MRSGRSDPRESAQSAPAAQPVGQRLFSLCRALLEVASPFALALVWCARVRGVSCRRASAHYLLATSHSCGRVRTLTSLTLVARHDFSQDLRDSLPSMPFGVRYLARLLVQLHVGDSPFFSSSSVSASASAGSTASSAAGAASSSGSDSAAAAAAATSPRAGDAKAVESKGETKSSATSAAESERERLVSDFLFLNWIVNGLMFPEPYLADCAPISQLVSTLLRMEPSASVAAVPVADFTASQPDFPEVVSAISM